MSITVESLHIYPMKSAAAVDVERVRVTPRGLEGDRRWMLIDERGQMLSARRAPRLLLVHAQWRAPALTCTAEGRPPLSVDPPDTDPTEVEIWGQRTTGRDAGDEAARWFSDYLGVSCRLIHQSEADARPVEPRPVTRTGDVVSFADSYPLLVIGTASLRQLNAWIDRDPPLSMNRFRPNLVVRTEQPFEEDHWTGLRIGAVDFVNAKPCPRCVLTTYDAETAEKDPDNEPLRTLARHRQDPAKEGVWFGTNLVPRGTGELRIGDAVQTA